MAEQNPWLVACQKGQYQAIEELLNNDESGVIQSQQDGNGRTPLLWACLYGWMSIVVLLFRSGADVNIQDDNGWSPLMAASRNGHSLVVKILIEKDAKVNMSDTNQLCALMVASERGHANIAKILIEKGAQVNLQNKNGWSALMLASRNGHINAVKVLIEKGARVNIKNNNGWSALIIASFNGRSNVIKVLIENNATMNMQDNRGQSALMIASHNGHIDIVKILLENGAEVNIQDAKKLSALMTAIENGHNNVVEILIEKYAEVNMQNKNGWSALMLASRNGHFDSDFVKFLIEKGALVNMQNNNGWSALIIASFNGRSNVIKVLIENNATVNIQDNRGQSALMIASHSGHIDIVKILTEKDAKVNMQDNIGWSALMAASKNGHTDIVKVLMENGAEINMLNSAGRTALIVACINGKKEVVQVLLDHHADSSVRDTNGKTAIDWSHVRGNAQIAHLLCSSSLSVVGASPSVETAVISDSSHGSPTSNRGQQEQPLTSLPFMAREPESADEVQCDANLPELTLELLYKELRTVTDPIQLGICLGLPADRLEIIRRNNPQDTDQQKRDVLSFVAKNSIPLGITWEKIADTLDGFMGMGNVARDIRSKFNIQPVPKAQLARTTTRCSNKEYISHDMVLFTDKSIGCGAFGAVFRGEVKGQPCAIKLLLSLASEIRTNIPISSPKDSAERFRKECEFLESFHHPNIVRHLATREHPSTKQLVLALELMDCNLRHFFTPQPDKEPVKLALPVQSSLCRDIASALEYIHSRRVVHRDLCGENILLSCGGKFPVAKVCDFGMSRITKSDTQSVSLQAFAHKGFMPPEATDMESSCYNSKFDIYSFGALMVQIVRHLLTIKNRKERKRELGLIPEDHPIKKLILDCLTENRDDRPSAAHLKRRLQ